MIFLTFALKHPFYDTRESQIDYFYFDKSISKNKGLSIQISDFKCGTIFCFEFSWYVRRDHAGPELSFGMFGKEVIINLYDKRHWDYKNNCWETNLT